MKEFEVWWNKKRDIKESEAIYKITTSEELIDSLAKLAWKAALEWALSNKTSVCYSLPVVLADLIEKELE